MSNKLVNKNKKEQNEKKVTPLERESKIMLGFLGTVLVGLFAFVIYYGYSRVVAEKEYYETMFEAIAPDFDNMEVAASAEEAPTEKVDGTIGFDAFYELRREKAKENLNDIKGVLGDELYVAYLNGLDSEYYKKSAEYDYNDMINDMDEILKEAGVIEALYNLYADTYDMPEYTECMDEECSLLQFIEDYTRDDLHDYLKERHDMWESVIEVEASRTNISDSYLNLFYQDKICADMSYLDNISVEVILLNKVIYDLGFDAIQNAYDTGYLKSKIITQDTKNYLETFSLYKDIDFYDDGFRDLAVDAFQAFFASDVVQNSVYLGQLGSASDANEELVNKLKDMGAPETDEEVIDYTKIENWNLETLSLGSRNEEDVLYMLWKVVPGSVKHTENIPSMESMMDEIKHDATYYMASRTISDTIYAELNDLSMEEVHDLLKQNYGYTDEELGALTEEEMRESLLKEQEKEEAAAQENLAEIRTHMEEHGYDLSDMSDEEVIEYYLETHQEALEEQSIQE